MAQSNEDHASGSRASDGNSEDLSRTPTIVPNNSNMASSETSGKAPSVVHVSSGPEHSSEYSEHNQNTVEHWEGIPTDTDSHAQQSESPSDLRNEESPSLAFRGRQSKNGAEHRAAVSHDPVVPSSSKASPLSPRMPHAQPLPHQLYSPLDITGEERDGDSRISSLDISRQQIGPLIILKTLGEGSFGKVKLAVHSETKQKYALKFISRQLLKKPDMSSRVDREIAYLKLLRHPHIIKLYDVIPTPTDLIMVIEYAGRELFDYIVQNGKMDENSARRFFQQIICAVEYCHRHKIVHRDLKPENLLLDDNLNVKIADFGLSNLMTDGNFLKTSCGSPNYAAPEVINGKLYAGPEVDIWSCGVILYVTLVGRLPFDDEYIPALFKKISNGTYSIPQWLSPGPANLLKRMLVVDSLKRITMHEIKADSWFQQDLPDYLRVFDENFETTEIDQNAVNKLSQKFQISNESVVEAISSTSPNDVKDAYQIIVENQALSARSKEMTGIDQTSLSQSPPPWDAFEIHSGLRSPSEVSNLNLPTILSAIELPGSSKLSRKGTISSENALIDQSDRNLTGRPNTIRILNTSKPAVHAQLMRSRKNEATPLTSSENEGSKSVEATITEQISKKLDKIALDIDHLPKSGAEQSHAPVTNQSTHESEKAGTGAASSDAAPPHISDAHTQFAPMPSIRHPKWHFGIRSRSPPLEVLSEIYRALRSLGAEFRKQQNVTTLDALLNKNAQRSGRLRSNSAASRLDGSRSIDDSQARRSRAQSVAYNPNIDRAAQALPKKPIELPKDLFSIRCRWTKYDDDSLIKGVRVYVDVQLYALERECYLVDFKCCGYEALSGSQGRVDSSPTVDETAADDQVVNSSNSNGDIEGDGASKLPQMQMQQQQQQLPADPAPANNSSAEISAEGPSLSSADSQQAAAQIQPSPVVKQVSSPFPFLEISARLIQSLI